MDAQPLYDLSPAIHVMLMGLVVALGPISWVWVRSRGADPKHRLQALTLLTLFLTFDLVMFGAFTRLTDSGLGCPDWPGCYGNASPTGAHSQISAAQSAMPTGPVTHTKAWIEMIHRYLATAVGVLIVTLAVASWAQRRRDAKVDAWWPTITLVWVCLQGAFGALTVTMKLFPAIVTMHLLGGLVLLALLCRQSLVLRTDAAPNVEITPMLRACLLAVFALVWLQAALGGWVSTNYAVLACSEFPTCQGSWWPAMDWRQGFEIWRALGVTATGEPINFAALTAIHYAHRLLAYIVIASLVLIAWQLRRGGLQRQARWIAALAVLQLATGLSNVVLGWPLVAAVGHTGGAGALVVALTWTLLRSRATSTAHAHPMKAGRLSA